LIANSSKPDPRFVTDKGLFRQKTVDKKAIVLNKLNFQNESSISSEMNFNPFFISTTKGAEPRLLTKGFYSFTDAQYTRWLTTHFLRDMDSIENPDRSLESEIYLADSDGNNFKMILGEREAI
jgi:hypothetical protein